MGREASLNVLTQYIKDKGGVECPFGHIDISVSDILGQGGNGIVYSGELNCVEIAIKFLINYTSKQLARFKAEFIDINLKKEKLVNIVNCIQYGSLIIEDIEFPYIIMKKYTESLKHYRKNVKEITREDFLRLYNCLAKSLKTLEECGIIHRDLKPENILIDEVGNFVISDFGIAHFEPEDFPIKDLTEKGERIGNYQFAAPEQRNGKEVSSATDLYSFAQVLYWYIFGETNHGIGGRVLHEVFGDTDFIYLNDVIYKCLNNNPANRLQSIHEITDRIKNLKAADREINPFDDMYIFSDIVRSTIPEFYGTIGYTENKDYIRCLVKKINSAQSKRKFEYSTGTSSNTIEMFKEIENGDYLLNWRQITICGIWGSFSSNIYDDVLIFKLENPKPYIINGEEHYGIAVINSEEIVPVGYIESGYIRYKDEVYDTSDLNIEERYIYDYDKDKYLIMGAFHQCSILMENDKYIKELQRYDQLDKEKIKSLKSKIREKKANDVYMYL